MNTLVTLGAGASFGVSCIAAGLPQLGWKTFFEEPAMLLGFVLVGRALEERAKLQASADMAALQVTTANCSSAKQYMLLWFMPMHAEKAGKEERYQGRILSEKLEGYCSSP